MEKQNETSKKTFEELEKEIQPAFFEESNSENELPDSVLDPLMRDRTDN